MWYSELVEYVLPSLITVKKETSCTARPAGSRGAGVMIGMLVELPLPIRLETLELS